MKESKSKKPGREWFCTLPVARGAPASGLAFSGPCPARAAVRPMARLRGVQLGPLSAAADRPQHPSRPRVTCLTVAQHRTCPTSLNYQIHLRPKLAHRAVRAGCTPPSARVRSQAGACPERVTAVRPQEPGGALVAPCAAGPDPPSGLGGLVAASAGRTSLHNGGSTGAQSM